MIRKEIKVSYRRPYISEGLVSQKLKCPGRARGRKGQVCRGKSRGRLSVGSTSVVDG